MLPLSFATALLGLVFVLAPQFSSAGLIQGPTGIEYVKRFAASPQPDALCLRCKWFYPHDFLRDLSSLGSSATSGIIMDGGDNGTREPDTPLGTSILLGAIPYIRCSYSKTNIQVCNATFSRSRSHSGG